jgi:small Trp-rich protein
MWFILIGLLLLLMKWFAFGPVADWSWWLVLTPFFLALLWFEVIEPFFGLDKRKVHDEVEKVKQERIRKQLERTPRR